MATPIMPGLLGGLNEEEIRNQALGSAALQAGLAGLMASGPSLSPVSAGQVLGQAGAVGLGAYQQGLQQAQQQQMQRQTQQAIQGVLGGQGNSGKMDMNALADKYIELGVMFSASDPQRSKFYFDAGKDLKEKAVRYTGEYANIANTLYGTNEVDKLTPEQRSNLDKIIVSRDLQSKAASAPKMSVNLSDPTAVAGKFIDIRNNYVKETSEPNALVGTYQSLVNAAQNPSPINDISLVFGFYKMIDPTSTVREGEYDTLLKSTSIPDQIKNYINRVKTGEKLTPKMRQEILDSAYSRLESKRNSVNESYKVHSSALKTLNIDPTQYISNPLANIQKVKIADQEQQPTAAPNIPNLQQMAQEELRRRGVR